MMKKRFIFFCLPLLAAFLLFFIVNGLSQAKEPEAILDRPFDIERLPNGNTLIVDGGGRDWTNQGSEILEVDAKGKIVWSFQDDLIFAHSAIRLENNNTLIVDTSNNRLIEINPEKEIVWSSENWPNKGKLADGTKFSYPNDIEKLPNGHFLVTDRNNDRLIEIDREGKIYWQKTGLNRPHNGDQTPEGNILVSDSEADRVIEINPSGQIVWSYGELPIEAKEKTKKEDWPLYWPRDVDRLENGHYLITDSRHHRVIEITPEGKTVWEYKESLSFPYEADRLENGKTLICDSSHARVIEVNPEGKIVWEFRNVSDLEVGKKFYGSFEKDRDGDGWPDGWIKGELLAEGKGSITWDNSVFKDGKRSGRIDARGEGMFFWHQYYQVKPGRTYRLISHVRTQELEGFARFEVIFLDKLGGQVGVTARTPDVFGTSGWERHDALFTPPKEAVAADIWALVEGNGTAWFDEIIVQQVGWQKILGLKLSLIILAGAVAIALILNKIIR